MTYRAYVVYQPCQHHVKPIEASQRIKLTSDQISRFQRAITFRTVSFNVGHENKEAKDDFVSFIRKGIPLFLELIHFIIKNK